MKPVDYADWELRRLREENRILRAKVREQSDLIAGQLEELRQWDAYQSAVESYAAELPERIHDWARSEAIPPLPWRLMTTHYRADLEALCEPPRMP